MCRHHPVLTEYICSILSGYFYLRLGEVLRGHTPAVLRSCKQIHVRTSVYLYDVKVVSKCTLKGLVVCWCGHKTPPET